jgi:HAMP domain-containing protein
MRRLNLHRPLVRSHLLPRTVRLRLTALYGALFAASGAVLLAITYLLVRSTGYLVLFRDGMPGRLKVPSAGSSLGTGDIPPQLQGLARQLRDQAARQHAADLQQLLIQSGLALAIMVVISIALGWLVAGRVLRPLRTMTATVQEISAGNLHERLAIAGPRDELKDLADTVDGLLGRLETAFDAQRRFVANAAHELRTPLTLERALLEETLTDPGATLTSSRSTSNGCWRSASNRDDCWKRCSPWPAANAASTADCPWTCRCSPTRCWAPGVRRPTGWAYGSGPGPQLLRPQATLRWSNAWWPTSSTTPCATTSPAGG